MLAVLGILGLAGCDNSPQPRPEKKVPIPKGDSTLDDLIRKSQQAAKPASQPGRLEVHPASLDFATVALGESAIRRVEVVNVGEAPVSLGRLRVAGQAAVFRLGGDCGSVAELAGRQSCAVDVTYAPLREGVADSELVIEPGGAGSGLFVALAGEGRPSRQSPVAAAAPTSPVNAQASLIFARSRQDGGLAVENGSGNPERSAADLDYAGAGLPGIVSSFPVDRSRVITADRYIPAVLENTISSQLPGRAIAVVERNVYGADARLVLIPAGSRVIGHYQSLARAGEARLNVNWTRILRPDGANINIDTVAADVMGRTGLPGDLDTRFFEKYGSSLLTSVIAAGGDLALNGTATSVVSPLGGTAQTLNGRAQAANRLGNDLDRLGQRMVQENVDIRPVLTVPQGTRLNIIPAEDIWLRDPDRMQAVTPPKGGINISRAGGENLAQLIPGLVDMLAQNPALQKLAPQTAQQIMQSNLLQQLRMADSLPTSSAAANSGTAAPESVRGRQ